MEPAQTVDVDRAVVHPDTLNQVGDTGRPLDAKYGLVDQIEYVAHFPRSLLVSCFAAHTAHSSLEFAWWASSSIQSAVVWAASANTWLNVAM